MGPMCIETPYILDVKKSRVVFEDKILELFLSLFLGKHFWSV